MSEVIKYPQSTNVMELEYIAESEEASAKLIATFKDGKRYSYSAVPPEVWARLRDESQTGRVGAVFTRLIKDAKYAYARLDDDLDLEEASEGRPFEEAPRRRYVRTVTGPTRRNRVQRTEGEAKASAANRRRTKPD